MGSVAAPDHGQLQYWSARFVCVCLAATLLPRLVIGGILPADIPGHHLAFEKSNRMQGRGQSDWRAPHLGEGVGMELVHRDAPSSPFSERELTREELHSRLVQRDIDRVEALGRHIVHMRSRPHVKADGEVPALKDPVQSGLNAGTGEYFVTLQVCT